MTTFNLKQVTVPLFGEVEANTAKWLSAFSAAGATTPVQVDSAALDIIAEELELDAEGLASDADRYVNGKYRFKARGMSGSRLGDLGEILTFLVNRATAGREVVRVVSWRAGAGQAVTGSRFPQPDFIFVDPGDEPAALEVKSTEAFDFIDMRDMHKKWTWLQPCSSVNGCRDQALAQLAYVNGSLTPQQHSLLVRDGKVVPFPVGKGVAAAVVAVDGRVNDLRADARFKTPKTCRQAGRDCWSCISATCHFALVTMPNAPGALSLAGADHDGSTGWLRAYRRWSQAIAAHDVIAVQSTIAALAESITTWLDRSEVREPEVLRAFWGSYLSDAMRTRGFDVEVPEQLGDLGREGLDFRWSLAPLSQIANREASMEEIARIVVGNETGQVPVAPFMVSARVKPADQTRESLSVVAVADFTEFRFASSTWWTSEAVTSTETASRIAARLFTIALEASHQQIPPHGDLFPLREVVAYVGEQAVPVGWETKPARPHDDAWWHWWREWPYLWFDYHPRHWPPWPALLALGDQRVRLRVLRDGRATLRIHNPLLRRWE